MYDLNPFNTQMIVHQQQQPHQHLHLIQTHSIEAITIKRQWLHYLSQTNYVRCFKVIVTKIRSIAKLPNTNREAQTLDNTELYGAEIETFFSIKIAL